MPRRVGRAFCRIPCHSSLAPSRAGILGGGNEGPGAFNLFEFNTLDKCSYESSDTVSRATALMFTQGPFAHLKGVGCVRGRSTHVASRRMLLSTAAMSTGTVGRHDIAGIWVAFFLMPAMSLLTGLFKNIRNTEGSGVQGITIQAVYLDGALRLSCFGFPKPRPDERLSRRPNERLAHLEQHVLQLHDGHFHRRGRAQPLPRQLLYAPS